ncbi:hypothetical protein L873DRAFT_239964 [Choiromyces venosus 120613-1]|uniref:Uncharacterized protein n=1 Tax=Choiromyces venosus 120613-1 TaxID=1336337 RepID=A0A3N4J6R0_9PEZI|nr:hypothetical protein L873DRAFT_239964 [Choiromyces venosus 120613-1]
MCSFYLDLELVISKLYLEATLDERVRETSKAGKRALLTARSCVLPPLISRFLRRLTALAVSATAYGVDGQQIQ